MNAIDGLLKTFTISREFSLLATTLTEQSINMALSTQGTSACKAAEGMQTSDNPLSETYKRRLYHRITRRDTDNKLHEPLCIICESKYVEL